MNKTVTIIAIVGVVAAFACVLCAGGGIFVVSNPSLVQIGQLDNYQFTSTPFVVIELPTTIPPVLVPTSTPVPTSAPAPASTPVPTATAIVFNLEEAQAKTDVELSDFVPFFAEVSRQKWDDEITGAQAEGKIEKLNSIFSGKHLLDTEGIIDDVDYFEYSEMCRPHLVTDYSFSTGNTWADISFKEIRIEIEIRGVSADYCRSFNIGQQIVVSGEIEKTGGSWATIINPTIK